MDTGLAALGFNTINLDAGYIYGRDATTGRLLVNQTRFPSGIRHLSDTLHAMNFRLGVYTDLSGHSCGDGPRTGSLGHYSLDAATFAHEWQVDYLKVDFCGPAGFAPQCPNASDPLCVSIEADAQYTAWASLRDALNATGRPIYYSICPHTQAAREGPARPFDLIYAPPTAWTASQRQALANSLLVEYYNTMDSWDNFVDAAGIQRYGILTGMDAMVGATHLNYSVAGSWNDADMLMVCNYGAGAVPGGGMTLSEYRAHYAVWSILGSPLILGNDVRALARGEHADCLDLLLNSDIVGVNQDPAAMPARLVWQSPRPSANSTSASVRAQCFARPLSGGRLAVLLLNRAPSALHLSVTWRQLQLPANQEYDVYDVLSRRAAGSARGSYAVHVASHDVAFVILGAHG